MKRDSIASTWRWIVFCLVLFVVTGCQSAPDDREERWAGPLHPAKARRIVMETFTMRAHPNDHLDRPRPDHELVSIDDEGIRFRKIGDPPGPIQEVRYRDVSRIGTEFGDGPVGRSQTVLVHLVAESESVRQSATRTDLMTWIGIGDPYLVFRERDPRLVPHFRRALAYLAARGPVDPGPSELEAFREEYEIDQARRRKAAEKLRRQYDRIERLLDTTEPTSSD